jgi:hypothetical protein
MNFSQEYIAGNYAGWRSDEIVTPKSEEYMAGYDAGQLGREEHDTYVRRTAQKIPGAVPQG